MRTFKPRIQDAVSFAQERRVLLISDASGTPVDISLGIPGYEEEVVLAGVWIRCCQVGFGAGVFVPRH